MAVMVCGEVSADGLSREARQRRAGDGEKKEQNMCASEKEGSYI